MRRNFQIILTISLVIILQLGFWTFTFIAKSYINDEIIEQAKNDNKVIGEQLITLLSNSSIALQNSATDSTLQHICDEIKLPNGGFICAINPEGNMVAAPGLKPGSNMPFPPILQEFGKASIDILPANLKKNEVFQGFAHFKEEGRRDVVASVQLNSDIRLFVHQNTEIIKETATQYVKPLLLLGIIITLVAGIFTFVATNRIVNSYESKIEKQNDELKDALYEINEQQVLIVAKNEELEKQGKILQKQHDKISIQNKEITDSIQYAKRIQNATLPKAIIDKSAIAEHFILFMPRDIVSGDFYWYHDFNDRLIIAAVDCTGHGVPGAFMSMIGISFLNEIVIEKKIHDAGVILDRMRTSVINALGQNTDLKDTSDGMDMSLCVIDKASRQIQFAGAFNPMVCIRNKEILEYKGDRMPVGIYTKMKEHFTTHTIQVEKNDVIYLYSDGYADQFGGKKSRKFLSKNFRNLLLQINGFSMEKQKEALAETLHNWKGSTPQIDDILVVGLRIK